MVTGPGEIVRTVGAAVLAGDDMFDVERKQWQVILVQLAILTPAPGAGSDERTCGSLHAGWRQRARRSRAFAWRIAIKSPTRMYVSYSPCSSTVSSPSLHLRAN